MKKLLRNSTFLIVSLVSLSSCQLFFPQPKITAITIEDFHNAYALGETFLDNQELEITAKWNDGKYTTLNPTSVSYVITCDGASYSASDAFTVTGTYSLTVKKDKVTSNTVQFTVQENSVYASSMSLSGEDTVKALQSIDIALNVDPANYTQKVSYEISDSKVAKVKRTKTGFTVTGEVAGEVDLTVKIKSSETEELSYTHHIDVLSPIEKTEMKQTYQDYMSHRYYPLNSCPLSGSPRLLVIPIWFTDSDTYIAESKKEQVREDISTAYFGTSEEAGWESVSSFYNKESSGDLTLTGTVTEWYEVGTSSNSYATSTGATVNLLRAAVDDYFTDHPSDSRTNYDLDQDGYLDGVMMIYGAPDYRTNHDNRKNLWAYCYWAQGRNPSVAAPNPNVFFWASYDFMYGQTNVSERTGGTSAGGDTRFCTLDTHTFIHEMGHVLGLEDYYDYSSSYNPAGGFSMQDYNVGSHDAYSIMAAGWADPYIPTESLTLRIGEFQKTRELVLLTPSFNSNDSPFDEYLLLELYSPNGLNAFDSANSYSGYYPVGPSQTGIRLWHVDSRLTEFKQPMPAIPKFYTNATKSNVQLAMSNTYYSSETADRISVLGKSYADYNILQLIRNNTGESYKPTSTFSGSHMFFEGDTFNMKTYKSQFKRDEALNSNKKLGWSFKVTSIEDINGVNYATIEITKG